MSLKPIFDKIFKCPKCGSERWGTCGNTNNNFSYGHCNECDFKWYRSEDIYVLCVREIDPQTFKPIFTYRPDYNLPISPVDTYKVHGVLFGAK